MKIFLVLGMFVTVAVLAMGNQFGLGGTDTAIAFGMVLMIALGITALTVARTQENGKKVTS